MSNEKMISERFAVIRERNASARMRCAINHEMHIEDPGETPCRDCRARATELYPLPKIERPRVVRDDSGMLPVLWRVAGGCIQWTRNFGHHPEERQWRSIAAEGTMYVTTARVVLLADLLANPTELVDDPGSEGTETR